MRPPRPRRPVRVALALSLAFALTGPPPAFAEDAVVFTNGREIRGKVLAESDTGVRVAVAGGTITYPRSVVREIRRDVDAPVESAAGGKAGGAGEGGVSVEREGEALREEHAVLYVDGERAGARTVRTIERPDGLQFEERVTFLDGAGKPALDVFTIERCDDDFRPVLLQVQETPREGKATLLRVEVVGDRAEIVETKKGDRVRSVLGLPEGARFPFGAREMFLRGAKRLGGELDAKVFDSRRRRFLSVRYEDGGERPVEIAGRTRDVRVIHRRHVDRDEVEWVDREHRAVMSELNGSGLRAMAGPRRAADAVARGEQDRVTGPDSAARTTYDDPVAGFSIKKPDPSWTFEKPAIEGAGALLSIRNKPLSASVDVMRDETPAVDPSVEVAAEALRRAMSVHAPDFALVDDGTVVKNGARVYWLEGRATTKGTRTYTLARVHVSGERVYRLLAACPITSIDATRAQLVKILDSFECRER